MEFKPMKPSSGQGQTGMQGDGPAVGQRRQECVANAMTPTPDLRDGAGKCIAPVRSRACLPWRITADSLHPGRCKGSADLPGLLGCRYFYHRAPSATKLLYL